MQQFKSPSKLEGRQAAFQVVKAGLNKVLMGRTKAKKVKTSRRMRDKLIARDERWSP